MSMNDNDVFDASETSEATFEPVDDNPVDDDINDSELSEVSEQFSNRDVMEIMKAARSYYNQNLDQATKFITDLYHLTPNFLHESIAFTLDDLKNYSDDDISKLYATYAENPSQNDTVSPEDKREDLIAAKTVSNSVYQSKEQYDSIQKIYREHVEENWKQRNSKDRRDKDLAKIEELRAEVENEEDPVLKRQMLHKLHLSESVISMSFISERIRQLTDKERTRVMEQFFDEKQGSYCMERMKNRAKKFKLDPNWYKTCFNLEENFLPTEYHIYNNLFLYAVTRFIAYADPYNVEDKCYVSAITNSIFALVYHKFDDVSLEAGIIQVIMSYDDYFKDYKEKFIKDNTTRPGHPVRENYSQKRELDRIEQLKSALVKFNIPLPENIDEMSANDIQKYFNEKVETMIKENTKESTGAATVEETDEGIVVVGPSFNLDRYRNPVEIHDGRFYYVANEDGYVQYSKHLRDKSVTNNRFMLELKNPDVPLDLSKDITEYTEEEKAAIKKEIEENIYYFSRFCFQPTIHHTTVLEIYGMYAFDSGIPFYLRAPMMSGVNVVPYLLLLYDRCTGKYKTANLFDASMGESIPESYYCWDQLYPVVQEVLRPNLDEGPTVKLYKGSEVSGLIEKSTDPDYVANNGYIANYFVDFEYMEDSDRFFELDTLERGYYAVMTTMNYANYYQYTNCVLKSDETVRFVTKEDGSDNTLYDLFDTDLATNTSAQIYIEIPGTEAYSIDIISPGSLMDDEDPDVIAMRVHMRERYMAVKPQSADAVNRLMEKIDREGLKPVSEYVDVQDSVMTNANEEEEDEMEYTYKFDNIGNDGMKVPTLLVDVDGIKVNTGVTFEAASTMTEDELQTLYDNTIKATRKRRDLMDKKMVK